MAWIKICKVDEVPVLGSRVVKRDGDDIAIFRTSGDEVFALYDKCPHKGGPLSQGIVHGKKVTCPLHNWVIKLDSGEAVAPDEGCAHRIDARIDAGEVLLNIEAA